MFRQYLFDHRVDARVDFLPVVRGLDPGAALGAEAVVEGWVGQQAHGG